MIWDSNSAASLNSFVQVRFPMTTRFGVAIESFVELAARSDESGIYPLLRPQVSQNSDVSVELRRK